MEAAVERMEGHLRLWRLQIDELASRTQRLGAQPRFDSLMHVDELKALLAIAQSKFDAYRAAGEAERRQLKIELKRAWDELEAALKDPKPRIKRRKSDRVTESRTKGKTDC
jgi:hypothetical protein